MKERALWACGACAAAAALLALYGYASFAADICRWMRLLDAAILQRGGRHG